MAIAPRDTAKTAPSRSTHCQAWQLRRAPHLAPLAHRTRARRRQMKKDTSLTDEEYEQFAQYCREVKERREATTAGPGASAAPVVAAAAPCPPAAVLDVAREPRFRRFVGMCKAGLPLPAILQSARIVGAAQDLLTAQDVQALSAYCTAQRGGGGGGGGGGGAAASVPRESVAPAAQPVARSSRPAARTAPIDAEACSALLPFPSRVCMHCSNADVMRNQRARVHRHGS